MFTKEDLLVPSHDEGTNIKDVLMGDAKYTSQTEALLTLLSGRNCFLSGPAGSGKSFVVNRFVELAKKRAFLEDDEITAVKTSTTGLSAINIDGITIHSFAGMGVNNFTFEQALEKSLSDIKEKNKWRNKNTAIRETDILLIDEISMLSERGFAFVVKRLKAVFGTNWKKRIQLVVSGDFTQLPPVNPSSDENDEDCGNFCYDTEMWKECDFAYLYLDKVHRAKDKSLSEMLSLISVGRGYSPKVRDIIKNVRITDNEFESGIALLKTTNVDVDKINREKQDENDGEVYTNETLYGALSVTKEEALSRGIAERDIEYAEKHKIPTKLKLKIGDTIMITENQVDLPLVNGTIGTFVVDKEGRWGIRTDEEEYFFEKATTKELSETVWRKDENGKLYQKKRILAIVKQYPMKLAYAITVHKSQGQTYSKVAMDLSKCWCSNLGYVALSRATHLGGITLIRGAKGGVLSKLSLSVSDRSIEIKKDMLNRVLAERNLEETEKLYKEFCIGE